MFRVWDTDECVIFAHLLAMYLKSLYQRVASALYIDRGDGHATMCESLAAQRLCDDDDADNHQHVNLTSPACRCGGGGGLSSEVR